MAIPKNHLTGRLAESIIVQEIKNCDRYLNMMASLGSFQSSVTLDYAYRGLLPLIYKYTKGIVSLFYYETQQELDGCKLRIDSIFSAFDEKKEEIYRLCGKPTRTKAADALLMTIFNPVNIASDLNVGMDGQAIDSSDARDQEEILYPTLYDLRRKGEQF